MKHEEECVCVASFLPINFQKSSGINFYSEGKNLNRILLKTKEIIENLR